MHHVLLIRLCIVTASALLLIQSALNVFVLSAGASHAVSSTRCGALHLFRCLDFVTLSNVDSTPFSWLIVFMFVVHRRRFAVSPEGSLYFSAELSKKCVVSRFMLDYYCRKIGLRENVVLITDTKPFASLAAY